MSLVMQRAEWQLPNCASNYLGLLAKSCRECSCLPPRSLHLKMMSLFRLSELTVLLRLFSQCVSGWRGEMSNQSITVLAVMIVIFWIGFSSRAIPAKDQAKCSVSSREPCRPEGGNQRAIAGDESEDVSDNLGLLLKIANQLPLRASVFFRHESGMKADSSYLLTSVTLESQHTLLRL